MPPSFNQTAIKLPSEILINPGVAFNMSLPPVVESYEGLVKIQAFVDGQALSLPISEPLVDSDYVVFDSSSMSVMFYYPADYLIKQGKDPSERSSDNKMIMVAAFDNEGNLIEVEANMNDRLDAGA